MRSVSAWTNVPRVPEVQDRSVAAGAQPHPCGRSSAGARADAGLLHRRQYVVGPGPVLGWPAVQVGELCLSHHPELSCRQVSTPSGTWTLLGDPVQTDSAAGTPAQELTGVAADAPQATTRSWAGRWLLLDPVGAVHLDASGLLGCTYRSDGEGTWASSSPALLARLPGLAQLAPVARSYGYEGANYHCAPGAGFAGLDRLLPSQVLDLGAGRVRARRLMPGLPRREVPDVARELCARLAAGTGQVAAGAGTVWLALTAGVDSRTLLAAALVQGVPVRTFTQLHDRMSLADRLLPPRMAAAVGVPHMFLPPQDLRPERLDLYDRHTGGAAQDKDRDFYPRGQWDFVQAGDVVLRANAFEVVASSWQNRVRAGDAGSAVPPTAALLRMLKAPGGDDFERDADRWRQWAQAHPEPALQWVDRLYWEQRLGSWAATTEQSLDLLPGRSVVLPNSLAIFQALGALTQTERRGFLAQRALLSAQSPVLAGFPVNPRAASFSPWQRLRHASRRGPVATARLAARRLAAQGHLRSTH